MKTGLPTRPALCSARTSRFWNMCALSAMVSTWSVMAMAAPAMVNRLMVLCRSSSRVNVLMIRGSPSRMSCPRPEMSANPVNPIKGLFHCDHLGCQVSRPPLKVEPSAEANVVVDPDQVAVVSFGRPMVEQVGHDEAELYVPAASYIHCSACT